MIVKYVPDVRALVLVTFTGPRFETVSVSVVGTYDNAVSEETATPDPVCNELNNR